MTKTNLPKTLKSKSVWILTLILIFALSLCGLVACGNTEEETEESQTSITKTENDDAIIQNGSFEFGSAELSISAFPQTSISGWTKAVDNSAYSSSVNSGIVDLRDDYFKELLKTLCSDDDFWKLVKEEYAKTNPSKSISEIEAEVKASNPDVNDSELKKLVYTKFVDDGLMAGILDNPSVNDLAKEKKEFKVFMLNNFYNGSVFFGTAQKLTSSKTITLEKGSFGKISVWINTQNIENKTHDGHGGANIRIINNVNSVKQKTLAIYDIDTEGVWKQYSIYVKADDVISNTVQLVLGLGFGNGTNKEMSDYVKGTVFFDDAVFEEIDEEAYNEAILNAEVYNIDYSNSSTDSYEYKKDSTFNYALDLSIEVDGYFENVNLLDFSDSLTTTSVGTTPSDILSGGISESNVVKNENDISVTLTNSSVTLTSPEFSVPVESYVLLTFTIENNLSEFDTNGITVYIKDSANKITKATSFVTVNDSKNVSILVKNDFPESKSDIYGNQTFNLIIVVGPTNINDIKVADKFSTGSVVINNFKKAEGKTFRYERNYTSSTEYEVLDTELPFYTAYTLYTGKVDYTASLYAGYTSEYAEEATKTYNLEEAKYSKDTIKNAPSDVAGYTGVTPESIYILDEKTHEGVDYKINTRSGLNGDGNGNYAGLINTDYLDAYNNIYLTNALKGAYTDSIQPIMIYNNDSAYGFIGESKTISSSSYAKFSVTLRVTGDAISYVYLVDTQDVDKNVLKFSASSNTNGYDYTDENAPINKELSLKVDSSMMDTTGWVTVNLYVATGTEAKDVRLEVWNGSRTGEKTTGFVFINSIDITLSSAFTEPDKWENAFKNDSSSVLYLAKKSDSSISNNYLLYKRVLTDEEVEFNKENPDNKVSYNATIIWAENSTTKYAIFNTIEPVIVSPSVEEETEETEGCGVNADPSTFWLSLSSILLAICLIIAIIMLFVKTLRGKKKANKSDAKSHFKVTSRVTTKQKEEVKPVESEENIEEIPEETVEETAKPEANEDNKTEEENKEESSNDYVYGEVQDFGAEEVKTEETTEEQKESSEEDKTE